MATPILRTSLTAVLIATTAGAVQADAGLPADPLRHARTALASYDLTGSGTTELIARLGGLAESARSPADAREARYLRAMASADLVLLAARKEDPALAWRVAASWEVSRTALVSAIQEDLRALMFGAYGAAAADALHALETVGTGGALPAAPVADRGVGLRSGAARLKALAAAASEEQPEGALARWGTDPCPGDAPCHAPYGHFAPEGRRAVAGLAEAASLAARLRDAARHGDPFARALDADLDADVARVRAAVLRPTPRLEGSLGIVPAPSQAPSVRPDLVIVVLPGEVRYGWWPRVRLGPGDQPVVDAPAAPVLPETVAAAIPHDFRPAVLAIEELTEALRREVAAAVDAEADAVAPTLGVAASGGVPAHVVARVLHSATRAGLDPIALVGLDPHGAPRAVAVRFARGRDASRGDVHVRVRLGGYSLATPRGADDIPRVRGEEGLRFDVDALFARTRAAPHGRDGASLDFMTVVEAGPVAAAAFQLARAHPLTVLLP